jgi:hypothetical protein
MIVKSPEANSEERRYVGASLQTLERRYRRGLIKFPWHEETELEFAPCVGQVTEILNTKLDAALAGATLIFCVGRNTHGLKPLRGASTRRLTEP